MREEHLEIKQQRRRSFGDRFLENLHALVAVVVLVLAGGYAAGRLFVSDAPQRELERVKAAQAAFDDAAHTAVFPHEARLAAAAKTLADAVVAEKPPSLAAGELPKGLTYPAAYLEVLKPGSANEVKFAPPTALRAEAEVGGVALTWADPAGNNVPIKAFEVLRSEGGREAEVVATLSGATFLWKDAGAAAGTDYAYRVRSVTEAAGRGGEARSEPSEAVAVRAIADFKIAFAAAGPAGAEFKVAKWVDGAWRERNFVVAEGALIGGRDDALGTDFSTGRRLAKLATSQREETRTRDEVVFDADARVVVEGGAPKRTKVTSTDVVVVVSATLDGGRLPPETLTLERR